jgi:hypothetical protein
MSLDNLVGKTLEAITPDKAAINRLVQTAELNIEQAGIETLSTENRFDIAYKAIMQLANAALQANGYRTLTRVSGHHQTMIQSLTKTIGLDSEIMIVLDALRKQRNVIDYSGETVSGAMLEECILQAQQLKQRVKAWLLAHSFLQ